VLLATRFALGLAEGPIVPMSQTLILHHSSPRWRGFNMGFMQMVGAFGIAGFLGPVAATYIGTHYGWREAMYLSIAPGLIVAGLMMLLLRPDEGPPPAQIEHKGSALAAFGALLANRNMRVILAVAGLFTAWLVLQASFGILFLTKVKGLDPESAGWVAGMGGPGALAGGILMPWLSDHVGRKPVVVAGALTGIAGPIALLLLPGETLPLGIATLLGWFALGIGPLYCATVPTESVSPALATTAVGVSMGFAELFGGVVVPPIAGRAADMFGLNAVQWICAALALATCLVALLLAETAPCKFKLEEG
jgi:ACS family hexuronate transporter-like MFS transporter